MAKEPKKDPLDKMSAEVDRLLKKLPGADPHLRGLEPGVTRPAPHASPQGLGAQLAKFSVTTARPPATRLGVWGRVLLGVALAVLETQWPYGHGCGFGLFIYLAVVTTVVVAGVWGSIAAWKLKMGVAHVLSLAVVLWGIALVAGQVLPRVGYAAQAATWRCP